MEGITWGSFNTFILTQAGRRRATHFVKLVSSQVEKTEKWSGLAIKQLTSYCVPSPEQMGKVTSAGVTHVPHPGAHSSLVVLLCVGVQGHTCTGYHQQHAAGWFQSDNEKAQCSNTRPPRDGQHWRHSHAQVRVFVACSTDGGQFWTKQGKSFHSAWNKVTASPLLHSSACLFLRQSTDLYANIYRVLMKSDFL